MAEENTPGVSLGRKRFAPQREAGPTDTFVREGADLFEGKLKLEPAGILHRNNTFVDLREQLQKLQRRPDLPLLVLCCQHHKAIAVLVAPSYYVMFDSHFREDVNKGPILVLTVSARTVVAALEEVALFHDDRSCEKFCNATGNDDPRQLVSFLYSGKIELKSSRKKLVTPAGQSRKETAKEDESEEQEEEEEIAYNSERGGTTEEREQSEAEEELIQCRVDGLSKLFQKMHEAEEEDRIEKASKAIRRVSTQSANGTPWTIKGKITVFEMLAGFDQLVNVVALREYTESILKALIETDPARSIERLSSAIRNTREKAGGFPMKQRNGP